MEAQCCKDRAGETLPFPFKMALQHSRRGGVWGIGAPVFALTENVGPEVWGVPALGLVGYLGAGMLGIWIVISILRS